MIDTLEMLKIFKNYRGNSVVIPGRGGKHWVTLTDNPSRDIPLGDPAMGGHASYAFGLALAIPDETVVLFDSEGDLLMNTGALATIADLAPKNFYHFLLDNECYATTGGQPVPNAQKVDYTGLAQSMGYGSTYFIDNLEDFDQKISEILSQDGPVFIHLKINPEIENVPINQRVRWQNRSWDQVLNDVKSELSVK
ncbi:MAG: hypothetical protein FI695_00780 [SAR202 cluster bacterium]|nr:hypothetical protein [Chloroflexota bacterium]MQG50498.1 hypothetical protein [SAR202 cluster bacterium]|tara:strand:- start:33 stop:617 length:585 start_codon:yes stop_codon:yes gene_type:complete